MTLSTEYIVFVVGIATFLSGLLVCKILRVLAIKYQFVDKPGGRKQHLEPVPPVGGVCIFTVFFSFQILFSIFDMPILPVAVNAALFIILILGVLDDKYEVDARAKFFIHFVVAGLIVWGTEARVTHLGDLFGAGDVGLGWFSSSFTVMCIVYVINAVNMMDGLDGLAGGNSLIILGWFGLAAFIGGDHNAVVLLSILYGGICAFLFYNARSPWRDHAKIFLGDAGTMALGVIIAWFAINLSQGPKTVLNSISVAWIIALPIIDAFGVFLNRLLRRQSLFSPDHSHFHHHFIKARWSVGRCVAIILLWSFFLGSIGFFAPMFHFPLYLLGFGWVILWIGHAALTYQSESFSKLIAAR